MTSFSFWNSWQVYALGAALFASLTAIFGKLGVTGLNSNFATFVRTVVILVVTAAIVSSRHEWQRLGSVSKSALGYLVLSGIATGLSWLCYFHALQLGPASRVAPVDKLSVILVILLSALFLGEPLTAKVITGGLLILAGSFVLLL